RTRVIAHDCPSEPAFNSFRSRGGCPFLASLDAKLERMSIPDWPCRDGRLRLHARGAETTRSIAAIDRSAPENVASGAGDGLTRHAIPHRQKAVRHEWVPR